MLISTPMDMHSNVYGELATAVDLITVYQMAPHEDAWESRERAARNRVTRLRDEPSCGSEAFNPSKDPKSVHALSPPAVEVQDLLQRLACGRAEGIYGVGGRRHEHAQSNVGGEGEPSSPRPPARTPPAT